MFLYFCVQGQFEKSTRTKQTRWKLNSPTNLTFQMRCGNMRLSGPKTPIFCAIWPNTDFMPSGPAKPPLPRDFFTCKCKNCTNYTSTAFGLWMVRGPSHCKACIASYRAALLWSFIMWLMCLLTWMYPNRETRWYPSVSLVAVLNQVQSLKKFQSQCTDKYYSLFLILNHEQPFGLFVYSPKPFLMFQ